MEGVYYVTLCSWRSEIWQFRVPVNDKATVDVLCRVCIHPASCDSSYCRLSPSVAYISAWASALLVLTGRAMPEPQTVGRADR